MNKKTILLILICGIVFTLTNQFAFARTKKIKVAIEILFDSQNSFTINQRVTSFIKRELRALNDVDIVEENEDIKLRIMGMENVSQNGGHNYGFTISAISLFPILYGSNITYSFWGSTMFTTSENGLSSTSENIVAWFDQNSIEVLRNLNKKE